MDFDQLRHAGAPRRQSARHHVDQLIRLYRCKPCDRRFLHMKFQWLVASTLPQLGLSPIFGDRNIGIFKITGVKYDALRIGFRPPHAEAVMKREVRARH